MVISDSYNGGSKYRHIPDVRLEPIFEKEKIMRYKKKPVEVEAMRFFSDSKREAYQWAIGINKNINLEFLGGKTAVIIPTLEGDMICQDGDYIIKGVQGELYPCKPDIFEKTYEPISE